MFVLTMDNKGVTWYWQGGGYFTLKPEWAKKYDTWQQANRWCNQIKNWDLKYDHLEDIEDRKDLRVSH